MLNRVMVTVAIAVCMAFGTVIAGIVNNSGTSAEDYIAIPFQLLDSEGMPVEAVSGDKYTLVVWYPDGSSAYTVNDASITTSADVETETFSLGGQTIGLYTYNNEVADIVGTPADGTYKYTFVAYDSSLQLYSTYSGEFQLYTTADISDTWDSTRYADVVAINGDTDAADNLDAAFDATIDSTAILDLKQLRAVGSANDGVESGILVREHGAGHGLDVSVDSTGAHAAWFYGRGTQCSAVRIMADANQNVPSHALELVGNSQGSGLYAGAGSYGHGMWLDGGSVGGAHGSRGLYIRTHGGDSPAIHLECQTGGHGILIESNGTGGTRPGIYIRSGDSAAIVLNGAVPSLDSTDFSADFLREIGRSAWKADTNNTVWNSDSSKFGHWNARRQEK